MSAAATGARVREQLAAGPARGLGCAGALARAAAGDDDVLRALVHALEDDRPVVVARAANALKKVQAAGGAALDAFARELLGAAEACTVAEARWNLLLLLGRIRLTGPRRAQALELCFTALGTGGALERVHALDALAHLSLADPVLRHRVRAVLERASGDTSAAVRARARKLLATTAK